MDRAAGRNRECIGSRRGSGFPSGAEAAAISAYVGNGANRWPAAHVTDVARLFRLVLEAGQPGAKYHAVAEEGVELRVIADAIGRSLGLPIKPIGAEEAREHFGPLSMFVSVDMPASARKTQSELGWRPAGTTLIADIEG